MIVRRDAWPWLVAAVLLPVAVTVADLAGGRGVFDEGLPTLTAAAGARSAALVAAVAALLVGLRRAAASPPRLIAWPTHAPVFVVPALALGVVVAVAVVADPQWFFDAGQEDGLVENLTAALFLVGGVLLFVTARRLVGLARMGAVGLGVLWVFSAGEEVSWAQRVLDFDGPDTLTSTNLQGEANLHNLATDPIEAAFYGGFTLLFVLLPHVVERVPGPLMERVGAVVPRSWLVLAAAPAVAMNVDMWDMVAVQLTVWTTVGVLAVMVVERRHAGTDGHVWAAVALALVCTIQVVALLTAERAVALHDITEFKELAMGLVVAAHGVDVVRTRSRRSAPSNNER